VDRIVEHRPETKVEEPSEGYNETDNSYKIKNLPHDNPDFLAGEVAEESAFICSSIERPQQEKISCNVKTSYRDHQIEIGPIKTAADDSSNPQDDRDPEEYIEASGQRHTEAGVTRKQRGTHFGQRRHPLLSPSHG